MPKLGGIMRCPPLELIWRVLSGALLADAPERKERMGPCTETQTAAWDFDADRASSPVSVLGPPAALLRDEAPVSQGAPGDKGGQNRLCAPALGTTVEEVKPAVGLEESRPGGAPWIKRGPRHTRRWDGLCSSTPETAAE
ncbi:hypothetical protein NDU88_008957 [Pleurodeles waltl]|uniref:Uncharacterized protein n=1 Tax=Pleurodeles waltl TaxID=8319 RepID=A0AAV7RWA6_PLEWA|nr:hypothetical protein NDU88_008957 [Pleurodeles waltl]